MYGESNESISKSYLFWLMLRAEAGKLVCHEYDKALWILQADCQNLGE